MRIGTRSEPIDNAGSRSQQRSRASGGRSVPSYPTNTKRGSIQHQLYGGKITKPLLLKTLLFVLVVTLVTMLRKAYNINKMNTSIRVFGPALSSGMDNNILGLMKDSENNDQISYQFYTRQEQRDFLLSTDGWVCHEATKTKKDTSTKISLLVERFDELPIQYGTELWKYCMLYSGVGNVYWQADNLIPLQLMDDILLGSKERDDSKFNIVIQIGGKLSDIDNSIGQADSDVMPSTRLHHSFIKLSKPKSKVALGMMHFLLDYDMSTAADHLVPLDTVSLQQTLSMFVANDKYKKRNQWIFWKAKCIEETRLYYGITEHEEGGISTVSTQTTPLAHAPCFAEGGQACCQVWTTHATPSANSHLTPPSLMILHPNVVDTEKARKNVLNPLPWAIQDKKNDDPTITDDILGMPKEHLPYVATVRDYPTNAPPATTHETPNFFDLLVRNNCLPRDKECYKCLKLGYTEAQGSEGGDCTKCLDKCQCYCNALCKIRPPPKRLVSEWVVTPPRYRKDPSRLIPRLIHQTWYEPVTPETYPNMSRLMESFRKTGWEFLFFDDDRAAQFLSTHFPPAVRKAYDALIPGAFKADLFRYCVLLILGGLYVDMDILLESNLDESIPPDVGFITPQDSPGETIGARSCLWNGLMGVAPGHPVLARTIQVVVNNIQNRYTSVDYDDMLCPNPVLSVSHTVDTLFTCGPCILGACLNDVLKRHRQAGFDFGEIDIFATEKQQVASSENRNLSVESHLSLVEPDDPRWLIPGRTVILRQNKEDMGAHRFTNTAKNLIVAVTDMPEYDDRPKTLEHYSKSHVKLGVYGLTKLYTNQERANEEFVIRVEGNPNADPSFDSTGATSSTRRFGLF